MPLKTIINLFYLSFRRFRRLFEALRGDLQLVRQEITELKAKEDKVVELREWKQKIDEVASPTQLSKFVQDIQDLNNFKTKAVTIFAVVQFAMGAILFAMNFIN